MRTQWPKKYCLLTMVLLLTTPILASAVPAKDGKVAYIFGFNKLKFGMTISEAEKIYKDLKPVVDNLPFDDPPYGADVDVYYRNPDKKETLKTRTIGGAILDNVYYFFKNNKFFAVRGVSEHKLTDKENAARETLIKKYQYAVAKNSKVENIDMEEMRILGLSQLYQDQFKKLHMSIASKYGVGNPTEENREGTYEKYFLDGW